MNFKWNYDLGIKIDFFFLKNPDALYIQEFTQKNLFQTILSLSLLKKSISQIMPFQPSPVTFSTIQSLHDTIWALKHRREPPFLANNYVEPSYFLLGSTFLQPSSVCHICMQGQYWTSYITCHHHLALAPTSLVARKDQDILLQFALSLDQKTKTTEKHHFHN